MYYPNMYPEILEAVHGYFEDEPSVEMDCMLYLLSLRDNWNRVAELSGHTGDKLEEMGRCRRCGTELATTTYREYHHELAGRSDQPYEVISATYCPVCDMGDEG